MAIGDIYRISTIIGVDQDSNKAVNNFHFQQAEELILDTPEEDLTARFRAEVEGAYLNTFSDTLTLFQYKVAKAPDFDLSHEELLTNVVGGLNGDTQPPFVSGVLSYKTATLTKSGRGRLYLPPANELGSIGGRPDSSYLTLMNALGAALVGMAASNINYAAWDWVLWSKKDTAARLVTSYTARNFWGHQSDRRKMY